jgi:uncharacterized protein YhbP (UPF0306 family)
MKSLQDTVIGYMQSDVRTLQLATVANDRPWIATVYFVADEEMNIYWLSWPGRRHSRELLVNPNAAAAVVVKTDPPVIGVQLEGKVELVADKDLVQKVMTLYIEKYQQGHKFHDNFLAGTNQHAMYRLRPDTIMLFDEMHYLGESPLEVQKKGAN